MKLAPDAPKSLTPAMPSLVRVVRRRMMCHFGAGEREFPLYLLTLSSLRRTVLGQVGSEFGNRFQQLSAPFFVATDVLVQLPARHEIKTRLWSKPTLAVAR
jgi:hypothetical protein